MSHVVLMIESRHVSEPLGIPREGAALFAIACVGFLNRRLRFWILLGHDPPGQLGASPIRFFRGSWTGLDS